MTNVKLLHESNDILLTVIPQIWSDMSCNQQVKLCPHPDPNLAKAVKYLQLQTHPLIQSRITLISLNRIVSVPRSSHQDAFFAQHLADLLYDLVLSSYFSFLLCIPFAHLGLGLLSAGAQSSRYLPFSMSEPYPLYPLAGILNQIKWVILSHTNDLENTLSPLAIRHQPRLSTSLLFGPTGIQKCSITHGYDDHSNNEGHVLKNHSISQLPDSILYAPGRYSGLKCPAAEPA